MSKYYKAEDVINAIEGKIAEYIPTLYGRYAEIPLEIRMAIEHLPTIEVSEDMGEVSDGYHTFNQLYHQRAILFATIVNQNKDKAWKSWKHEDGKFCFDKGGEWFIVGIDTPEGSYTYHYEKTYWDMFDCEELDRGKHWDGHTEEDVKRLLSLPTVSEDCISREYLKSFEYINKGDFNSVETIREWIDNAPSVVPRLDKEDLEDIYEHISESYIEGYMDGKAEGEWIEHKYAEEYNGLMQSNFECSQCHDWLRERTNYCPNCGAKMCLE